MSTEPEIFPGILGVAIVALVFVACCGVERLARKNLPDSGKYFWQGNAGGAAAGVIVLVVWMVRGNYVRSFWDIFDQQNFLSIVTTGAIMGLIPGGLLGLALEWVSSKLQKKMD